jgi:hypothetical protein
MNMKKQRQKNLKIFFICFSIIISIFNLSSMRAQVIQASAGDGGSISPSGVVKPGVGSTANFTITAKADYSVLQVLIDGQPKGPVLNASVYQDGNNHSISVLFSPNNNRAKPRKYVGVMYENWFDYVNKNGLQPVYPDYQGAPGFRYWGTPQRGRYMSSDRSVINYHADLLAAANMDIVYMDFSNGNINNPDLYNPIFPLLDEYQKRAVAGIPTPKIVFMVDKAGDDVSINKLYNDIYAKYDQRIFFYLGSKPLMMNWFDAAGAAATSHFTCRLTKGLQNNTSFWSIIEGYPSPVNSVNNWPEAIAVSAAQQESYMNIASAHGRNWDFVNRSNGPIQGKNFDDQWNLANQNSPTFVLIKAWNEWCAQRFTPAFGCPYPECFTDAYNPELSNCLEPMSGGHEDLYYQKLITYVAKYKRNAPDFFIHDKSSGNWNIKFGRENSLENEFDGNNFTNAFNWATGGDIWQPVAGDFNNDGRWDVAVRNTGDGKWYFAFSAGNGGYANTRTFQWTAGTDYKPIAGDFNGDGLWDLGLWSESTGSWMFGIFDGTSNYTPTPNFNWASTGTDFQPLAGDFNDDGVCDIALRKKSDGTFNFAFYQGPGSYVNSRSFSWAAGANYNAFVGDFDLDGHTDVGLYDPNNGKIYMANFDGNTSYANFSNYQWITGVVGNYSIFTPYSTKKTINVVTPTALKAVSSSSSQINLTWVNGSSNQDGFKIEQKSGSGTYTEVASVGPTSTSFVVNGLSASTSYTFRIRAYKAVTFSPYSNEASDVTLGTGDGLYGTIFSDIILSSRCGLQLDPTVNKDFGTLGTQVAGCPNTTNFSIRWVGKMQARFSELYTFYITGDDGVRLFVNNTLIATGWKDQAPTEYQGAMALVAGQKYDIRMEYYQTGGGASVKMEWSSMSQARQVIPQTQLYSCGAYIAADTSICQGVSLNLTASGGNAYKWSDNSTAPTLKVTPNATTTYSVSVSSNGCTANASMTVTVNSLPSKPSISQIGSSLHSSATTGNQWFGPSGKIVGATSQNYSPTTNGSYTVTVSDANLCSNQSNSYSFILTGIQNIEEVGFKMYPNPLKGALNIEFNKDLQAAILINNILGETVYIPEQTQSGLYTIPENTLSPGVYFIHVKWNGGNICKKVVIN